MKFERSDIPVEKLQKMGLTLDALEENGNLERLLLGQETKVMKMRLFDGHRITRGVLYLKEVGGDERREVDIKLSVLGPQRATREQIAMLRIPYEEIEEYRITKEILEATGDLALLMEGKETSSTQIEVFTLRQWLHTRVRLFLIIEDEELHFHFAIEEINH
jgi:hypothetical protein